MLELALRDGTAVFMNPEAIWYIRDGGGGTAAIHGYSGVALFVAGDAGQIAKRWLELKMSSIHPGFHGLRIVKDD
ncbi:hypothetical protein [Sphingomonas panni]|uniref:hypothetical protein n=2 Tax=Sphingomonas panni TaxID=237612 RepID=UPI001F5C02C9|nr:hypothetical protein [Sphingomonas panni]